MPEPQLSVRSARARDLAHKLAKREKRTVADIVERALEAYELRETGREPSSSFWRRVSTMYGADIDIEEVLKEHRKPYEGIDL